MKKRFVLLGCLFLAAPMWADSDSEPPAVGLFAIGTGFPGVFSLDFGASWLDTPMGLTSSMMSVADGTYVSANFSAEPQDKRVSLVAGSDHQTAGFIAFRLGGGLGNSWEKFSLVQTSVIGEASIRVLLLIIRVRLDVPVAQLPDSVFDVLKLNFSVGAM